MDPLLQRIEASPRSGEYSVLLVMADGQEQTVLARVADDVVDVPPANLGDWVTTSASYQSMVAAVRALHDARALAAAQRVLLQDVDGGWDVTLGNIVLGSSGVPVCIAHGELEPADPPRYSCPTCGAAAILGS